MSRFTSYNIDVSSGCDVVKSLQDFAAAQNLGAAFVMKCDGEICKATLRMADAVNAFEPVKEISDQAKIESFVGTVSGGKGHFHLSVSNKHGEMVGGHVFGPVLVSGTVHVVIGECRDLLFTRSHDQQTGYPELVVLEQDIDLPTDSHKPTTNSQSKKTVDNDSSVMVYAFRLGPGQDICKGLKKFASENKLKTPSIVTCVGSVTKAVIIDLNQHGTQVVTMEGHYEIVSLVGTPTRLEISMANEHGHVIAGHAMGELIVFTTAELVISDRLSCE